MDQRTTFSNPAREESGMFSWLSVASFSSYLRTFTCGRIEKETLAAIRKSALTDWRVDSATNTVFLEMPGASLRFLPKLSDGNQWIGGMTRYGPVTFYRDDAFAGQLEKRLERRLEGFRAELARGASSKWLEELAHRDTASGLIWSAKQDYSDRMWFGEGSYRDVVRTRYAATTSQGLAIKVEQEDAVTFISLRDAYREDQRYLEQSIEMAEYSHFSTPPFFSPFLSFSSSQTPWRPDPPLDYGSRRSILLRVQVASPSLDNIAQSLGFRLRPIASLNLEHSQ